MNVFVAYFIGMFISLVLFVLGLWIVENWIYDEMDSVKKKLKKYIKKQVEKNINERFDKK